MGGKKNQAQRTKNRVKPSSSGRSAELLGNQFSSFSGFKESGCIIPSFSLPPTEDMEIDTNFQLVFKKMVKKDSTTKLKALNEFSTLVKNSDTEAVKTVLPFWPRLFNVLAIDTEHKVREATFLAHNEVVQKVRRNLAPFLKQIIATWFISQYDTYPPAASAALLSFNNAFPEKKCDEAITFCSQEIISHIHDNLLIQTPQSVCDQKHNTPEESEAKYERVLTSSMHGYSLFLSRINEEKLEQLTEINRKIVGSSKFWKYSKHNLALVRMAWFEVLTALFKKAPFLLENEEGHVINSTLGNIDESDPAVLPLIWQNVLLTITSIKEWWTRVNIDKLMLPKLWKMLKEGGQGNASVIYPNLLPLLSNLIPIVDTNTFYSNFFHNLCLGLKQKSVVLSKSESTAVSTTLIECLQYVVLKNETDIELCGKLIQIHLFDILEWCFVENQSCYKSVFNQTAALIQYWSRNCTKEHPNYFKYLNNFWLNIDILFRKVLNSDTDSELLITISERQLEFLHSIKNAAKPKKKVKVNFETEEKIDTNQCYNPTILLDQSFLKCYDDFVYKIFVIYIKIIEGKNLKELLDHLIALIPECDSEKFFTNISKEMGWKEKNGVMAIFENLILKWLHCEKLWCKSLIDLVFLIYKHAESGEKQVILENIEKITNDECLGWCLEKALSHQHNKDTLIQKWLNSEKVCNFLVEIVEKEIQDNCPSSLSALLKVAITENEDEELYISEQSIFKILEKLRIPLKNPDDYLTTIDTCASFAAQLSSVVYTEKFLLKFNDELLLSMIYLTCSDTNSDYLSSDTLWEVETAWQDAFTTLISNLEKEKVELLLQKMVTFVQESLENEAENLEKIEKYAEILGNVCRSIHKATPLESHKRFEKLFHHPYVLEWRTTILNICNYGAYLNGSLNSCYEHFELNSDIKMEDRNLLHYFVWNLIKIEALTMDLENNEFDDEDNEEIEKIWSIIPSRIDWFADILYEIELLKCFLNEYPTVKFASKIQEYSEKIVEKSSEILNIMEKNDNLHLKELLKRKCYSESWIWCRIPTELSGEKTEIYEDFVRNSTQNDKLTVLHLTQSFSKYLNFDYVTHTFDDISRIVVLRSLIHCEEIDVQIAEVMSILEKYRDANVDRFNCKSIDMDWSSFQMILETARLFDGLIKYQWKSLSRRYIDLIIISLAEWMPNLVKFFKNLKILPLIITVTNLYWTIIEKVKELKSENTENALTKEWDDLFSDGIQIDLVKLWLNIAGIVKNGDESWTVISLPLIYTLSSMTKCFDYKTIFKSINAESPIWTKLIQPSLSLLTSLNTSLQIAAYQTLTSLIPGFIEVDSVIINEETRHADLTIAFFKKDSLEIQDIITTMLTGLKLCEDSCRIESFTHSFNFTFAYLLMWDIILTLCENSSNSLKYEYIEWMKHLELLRDLFTNVVRLMPAEIMYFSEPKKILYQDWFSTRVNLDAKDFVTSARLERMACWIYCLSHSQLPALVRQWWSGTETKNSQIIERVTSTFVSPVLCNKELAHVNNHDKKFKNMTIKTMPNVREVIATYTIDDAQMDLVITLPTNYPLVGPEVHCQRQIGKSPHKVWLMEFRKCLLHQNGRIWDGLKSWNYNLDRKFDGVEECYICFSILHLGTYQLPKLSCQTCKKKFHSACLYKWFSTSNKSSCPICRNLF